MSSKHDRGLFDSYSVEETLQLRRRGRSGTQVFQTLRARWSEFRWIRRDVCIMGMCRGGWWGMCTLAPQGNNITWCLHCMRLPVNLQRPGSAQTDCGDWPVRPRRQMPDTRAWVHIRAGAHSSIYLHTHTAWGDISKWAHVLHQKHQSVQVFSKRWKISVMIIFAFYLLSAEKIEQMTENLTWYHNVLSVFYHHESEENIFCITHIRNKACGVSR